MEIFSASIEVALARSSSLSTSASRPIHAPKAPRELIVVPAVLDDERFIDEHHREACGDSKPEVVVFARGKIFVEPADGFEETSADERGRW